MSAAENLTVQGLYTAWANASDAARPRYAERLIGLFDEQIAARAAMLMRRYSNLTRAIDQEDLEQEARIALLAALPRYDPSLALFIVYARSVVVGAMEAAISRAFTVRLPGEPSPDPHPLSFIDDRVALEQCLKQLPPQMLDVIQRRYYEGQTQAEAALEMRLTQQRVSQIEAEALAKLRELLEAE